MWQQSFALDPSIIGSTFVVDQIPYTVAGIAAPGFFGETLRSDPPDFWMPLSTEPALDVVDPLLNQGGNWLYVIGRLKQGARPERVQAELTVELQQWLRSQPELRHAGPRRAAHAKN